MCSAGMPCWRWCSPVEVPGGCAIHGGFYAGGRHPGGWTSWRWSHPGADLIGTCAVGGAIVVYVLALVVAVDSGVLAVVVAVVGAVVVLIAAGAVLVCAAVHGY